ncbi:hypothetical protein XENORESO_004609 [Xenotaenia resolanae]|uniref:Uncharacterized protein n=1 Tax=Xenotaenia resolanae TaxID=208358 RepID=A0ABV0W401_9TELE
MEASGLGREWVAAHGCRCGESAGGSSVSDSTLRVSALLSVSREMVGWEAGVRLGARAGTGTGLDGVEGGSPPPPSPSQPEDEDGVCSKYAPSSRERQKIETAELRDKKVSATKHTHPAWELWSDLFE